VVESEGSTLASEIRKSYDWYGVDDTINRIIDEFSPEEIAILQEDGNMAKELAQLRNAVHSYGMRGLFGGAIDKLTGVSDEAYEELEEDRDDSEH
jgi:hypothetical protein